MVEEIDSDENIDTIDMEFSKDDSTDTVDKVNDKSREKESGYEDILDEQPELKQFLEYKRLEKKVKSGDVLSENELKFMSDIELAQKREQEIIKAQEEQALLEKKRQDKLNLEILREYKEVKEIHPEKIIKSSELEITLTGGESIPKLLKLIFSMKKAKKKGGKVLVQVFRSRKVLVKWTNKDVTFVEFYTVDEKGNELIEVTRFSEYPYSFEGTPIPVLFAVQGYAEGFDFFSEFRKDLSSEMVSRLITRAFHAGYQKGAEVAQPKKKNDMLESLQAMLPLILLGGFAILGFLMYQMYQDNTTMLTTIKAMQTTLQTHFPDVNGSVYR
jgi:hypothetical protein